MPVNEVSASWLGELPLGQVIIGVAIIVTVGSWMAGVTIWIRKITKPMSEFLRDWQGEPERDGVDERPGVMKRLQVIEAQGRDTVRRSELDQVRGDMQTIRDDVTAHTAVLDLVRPYVTVDLPERAS